MNPPADPALADISSQTFRLVRKGYDPEEVRNCLRSVDAAVGRLPKVDDAAASAPIAAAVTEDPVADRWDGLGQHVARILAQAETEAAAMTEAARAQAATLAEGAEADRVAARDHLAQSELVAKSIVAEAETEAAIKRADVEPQVRQHIAETLAGAQSELDVTRAALRDARSRLTDIHALVGRSLGQVATDPSFAHPEDLLTPDAPGEGDTTTSQSSDVAATPDD